MRVSLRDDGAAADNLVGIGELRCRRNAVSETVAELVEVAVLINQIRYGRGGLVARFDNVFQHPPFPELVHGRQSYFGIGMTQKNLLRIMLFLVGGASVNEDQPYEQVDDNQRPKHGMRPGASRAFVLCATYRPSRLGLGSCRRSSCHHCL